MAGFKRMKYENPKVKQSKIANQIGYSSSTLQRYRNAISMLSPYRSQSNNTNKLAKKASNTNFNNYSDREFDVKRLQITSKDLKTNETIIKSKKKTKNF